VFQTARRFDTASLRMFGGGFVPTMSATAGSAVPGVSADSFPGDGCLAANGRHLCQDNRGL